MLKIGICDDDPTFVDDIEKNIEQTIKKHHWKCIIVKFTNDNSKNNTATNNIYARFAFFPVLLSFKIALIVCKTIAD